MGSKIIVSTILLLCLVQSATSTLYGCTQAGLTSAVSTAGNHILGCTSATVLTVSSTITLPSGAWGLDGWNQLTIRAANGVRLFSSTSANAVTFVNMTIEVTGPNNGVGSFLSKSGNGAVTIKNVHMVTRAATNSFISRQSGTGSITIDSSSMEAIHAVSVGIYVGTGTLVLSSSTLYSTNLGNFPFNIANTAVGSTVTHCTIHGWNSLPTVSVTGGTVEIRRSILSGYTNPSANTGAFSVNSGGFNLIERVGTGFLVTYQENSDSVGLTPIYGTFGFNGGTVTKVLPLAECSPGINGANNENSITPAFDQHGRARVFLGAPDSGAYESDLNPCIQWVPTSRTVNEANTVITFDAELSGRSFNSITIPLRTYDGTATAGTDYTAFGPTTRQFQFVNDVAIGRPKFTVSITILDDTTWEPTEFFVLNMSPASSQRVQVVAPNATITILDNDPLTTGITSADLSTGITSKDLSTGITSKDLSTGITSKDLSTGITSKDLSTGITSKDLSTGITSKDLSTGITSKDLSTGITSKFLSTGITSKDLSTGITSKDLSTGITSKDLSTGITSKDMSTGITSKDLSTGITSKDLSTGITSKDLSTGITSKDLSTGITSKDLSTGITSKDLSTGITSKDLSTGITSKDLSTGITSKDMSTGITSKDLSTGITSKDLSTGITSKDLSTGITSKDLSTGITSMDLSTGITSKDLSTGITSKDLSTGITSKDLSTGITSADLSTGITSKDLSTGITSADLSTGITSADLSTGITSRDLSTGITSADLSTGVTSRMITTRRISTTRSRLIPVYPFNNKDD